MAKLSLTDIIAKEKAKKPLVHPEAPKGNKPTPAKKITNFGLTKKLGERSERLYDKEVRLARDSKAGQLAAINFQKEVDRDLDSLRVENKASDIILDPSQRAAIKMIRENLFTVLIGAAGTGKTTTLKEILNELSLEAGYIDIRSTRAITEEIRDEEGRLLGTQRLRADQSILPKDESKTIQAEKVLSIACAAFTGRASQQMLKSMPKEYRSTCSTIHSMLGYSPTFEYDPVECRDKRVFRPFFDATNKLPFKIFIFDEAGMIPIALWNEFIDAANLGQNTRVILLGDINQLQPVMGKGVLGYAMTQWPVAELTTIHRQAADNPIIANAHKVLNGQMPVPTKGKFDIISTPIVQDSGTQCASVLRHLVTKLTDSEQFNPLTDAIIVPQNKGNLGQIDLNIHFMTFFNPERREGGVIVNKRQQIHTGTETRIFAPGDKVMSLANDKEKGLTNGMIGIVEYINLNGRYDQSRSEIEAHGGLSFDGDTSTIEFELSDLVGKDFTQSDDKPEKEGFQQRQASHIMAVKFPDATEVIYSTAGDYGKLGHAYAFTCHKAQGAEFRNVIILCHSANSIMLTREWLYTAITRARERVVLIGNNRGIGQALSRQVVKGKTTAEKVKSFIVENEIVFDPEHDTDRNIFPVIPAARKVEEK